MGTDEKAYNEMLKGLGRREGVKGLKPPKVLRTDTVKPTCWQNVEPGQPLCACKGLIPSDPTEAPILFKTHESEDCITRVEALLQERGTVMGPDGTAVRLDIPERDKQGNISLRGRAEHLCGKRTPNGREFNAEKAAKAGCVPDTIRHASLIAQHGNEYLYLRRYKGAMLHVVVVGADYSVQDQAFQTSRDLVTQYAPQPTNKFEDARVVYKNPLTQAKP